MPGELVAGEQTYPGSSHLFLRDLNQPAGGFIDEVAPEFGHKKTPEPAFQGFGPNQSNQIMAHSDQASQC